MKTLVKAIWKKYKLGEPSETTINGIIKKAKASKNKTAESKKYKPGTFVSWYARQAATKKLEAK